MKKKVHVKDPYVKGLFAAEELFKNGYYFVDYFVENRSGEVNGLYFKHPEGGSAGYPGMEYRFQKGMLDYIEHRKANPDIFGEFIIGYVYE